MAAVMPALLTSTCLCQRPFATTPRMQRNHTADGRIQTATIHFSRIMSHLCLLPNLRAPGGGVRLPVRAIRDLQAGPGILRPRVSFIYRPQVAEVCALHQAQKHQCQEYRQDADIPEEHERFWPEHGEAHPEDRHQENAHKQDREDGGQVRGLVCAQRLVAVTAAISDGQVAGEHLAPPAIRAAAKKTAAHGYLEIFFRLIRFHSPDPKLWRRDYNSWSSARVTLHRGRPRTCRCRRLSQHGRSLLRARCR